MTHCSDYEIELSALLDGESNPAMALKLVEHVASCPSCSTFVRELRATQAFIDNLEVAPDSNPEPVEPLAVIRKSPRILGLRPQWAVGLAALLIITMSFWFGTDVGVPGGFSNDMRDGELVIHLEEDKGRMSNERFLALVSELLRADRRYQNEMYIVLNEITQNDLSDETRIFSAAAESGEYDESEWNTPSASMAPQK